MEAILSFLRDNWQFVAEVGLSFIVLLIALFKKKVKVSIQDEVYSLIPGLVIEAEEKFGSGNGKEKLQFVLARIISYLNLNYGLDVSALDRLVPSFISQVEKILEAPTKKKGE